MRRRRASFAFIVVTIFIDMVGLGIIFPILPQLIASFLNGNLSVAAEYFGFFASLYAAMQFLFAPILGALSDQYGRRPVLLLSLFGAGLDYMLLSFAPVLALLFVGRVISGITAASFTVANAYIADASPPEERAQNFGIVGAAFGLGFIIGPVIGGVLGTFGPRVPFMAAGALTLINWLYGFFILPESLAPENRRRFSWSRANPLSSIGALGRYPVVLGLAAMILCTSLAGQALQSTWVLYTTYRFAWKTWQTGLSLALVGLLAIVVQGWLLRPLLPRLGERKAVVIALLFSFVGFVLYGVATEGWMMYVILVATGLSFMAQPAAQGLISNAVRADEQGTVQGALTSLISLTAVFGPVAATSLFSYFTTPGRSPSVPGAPFFLGAALTMLALLLAVRSFMRMPSPAPQAVLGEYKD